MKKTLENGFMAITTVMILSVILLLVATSLSFSGFFTRYNILDNELKKVSTGIAEACVDQALLKLAIDSNYPGGEIVNVSGNPCTIKNITVSGGGQKTINVKADYKHYVTNLSITINATTLQINHWQE